MAALGDLVVNLTANSGQFTQKMMKARGVVSDFALAATGAAVTAAGIGLVKLAADAETLQVQFKTLLGSAEDATRLMGEIEQRAASTPFQKLELADATRKLLAFNVSQDEALGILKNIGDISALTGNRIGDLAELYGKAKVQGRLFAEDINQLTGRGIPIIQELAKQFGVAESEVRKLVESGKVSADNITQAFQDMTGAGGKFQNGMEELSKTTAGRLSTLKDNLTAIGVTMGSLLLPAVNKLVTFVGSLITRFAGWARAIVIVGGAILAAVTAMRAITMATQAYSKAAAIAQALTGPKGWAQLAAGLAAATAATLALNRAFADVNQEMAQNAATVQKVEQEFAKLDGVINNAAGGVALDGMVQKTDDFLQRIRAIRDEVQSLTGIMSDSQIELRQAFEGGIVDPAKLRMLQDALSFRDAIKAQIEMAKQQEEFRRKQEDIRKSMVTAALDAADAIAQQIETPAERIDRLMKQAVALNQQGFLSDKELLKYDKFLHNQNKPQERMTSGALAKGSEDAMRAIIEANRNSPQLTEAKKQTNELKKISDSMKRVADRREKIERNKWLRIQGAV